MTVHTGKCPSCGDEWHARRDCGGVTSLTVNDLMILASDGDQRAINVLDMIDEKVLDRRTTPERFAELYWAS